jgi:hypothetical protein
MKNVFVHFVGDGRGEPENIGYQFADIPRIGEFISIFIGNSDQWFEVAAVVHLAFGENHGYDETNLNLFVAEIWLKNPVAPIEAIEKFSR